MKKKKLLIFFTSILIILLIAIIYYYTSTTKYPFNKNSDNVVITVDNGEGFTTLIDKLDNMGIIKSKLCIKIKIKINKINPNILPGTYEISKDTSLDSLIKMLETEDLSKNQISITIPEGYTIEKIGKVLEDNNLFSANEFYEAVKNYPLPEFVSDNKNKKYNLEGFLYPETYFFNKDIEPNEVIKTMLDKFIQEFHEAEKDTGVSIDNKDIETIITKASLVEKEVKIEDEKGKVASVIENRLDKNMKLEFCSTVNYVIGYEGNTVLTYSDIKVDSPYNTYKYDGLPVGPIASPSISSIKAVLLPDKTDYLYFLTKDGVSTYFSKTAEEHENAKKEMNIN
ncbi:MAG: endolytic transglycosylase MltG [Clostridiales bacterium]|nr:endolytic transglycosylase MltG [Clostridiales bacterium]